MNAGTRIRAGIVAMLAAAATGCGTVTQVKDDGAILSAADAQAMIRVKVTVLEQPDLPDDALIAAVSD